MDDQVSLPHRLINSNAFSSISSGSGGGRVRNAGLEPLGCSQPSHRSLARAPTSPRRPASQYPSNSLSSCAALHCPAVLYCPTHSFSLPHYYGCCRARTLKQYLCSSIPSDDNPILLRCRAQPTSTPPSPPPAHCGAVTHWHPTSRPTPTTFVAASVCQHELTRDHLNRP